MYESIYVPVDNSDYSHRAVKTGLDLGKAFDSRLTGCHVYAARMHDYRFKQMEFTLPEEYLEEAELARQRKIHDSLITMGLELVSDCYLETMDHLCQAASLPFTRKMMDGKHSSEILKDIAGSDYDLVVLGAQGIGATRDSQLGSVTRRVTRQADRDVWVVKHLPKKGEGERDTILVGVDGSPQSFGALDTAIDLAKRFGKKLELVAVYDPYLHYAVFKGIVEVLTERAAKVFRFEEQNQLHEEVIDTGLAEIYQSHLNVAEKMAADAGVTVTKTLLDGKAFQKVLDHVRKVEPWVLVVGRVGIHSEDDETGLGSNTDNLLRLSPCDVLLTTASVQPQLDLKAEESIHWTPEAETRLGRAPKLVRGIARTAILRLAVEQGHSVVTSDLVTQAMERYMPKYAAQKTEKLAEALAFERARQGSVAICKQCGVAAKEAAPVRCAVCGEAEFETVDAATIDEIEAAEGGSDEETTYDGRKLRWTQESRKALKVLTDAYQRRRAKARIEKAARAQRLEVVSVEMARRFIEEEGGVLYEVAEAPEDGNGHHPEPVVDADGADAEPDDAADDADLKLVARDERKNPLFSRLAWSDDAVARMLRVPAGFMRDRTQARVEELATARGLSPIGLELVEEGIELGVQMMAEMLAVAEAESPAAPPAAPVPAPAPVAAATAPGKCPAGPPATNAETAVEAAAGGCPHAAKAREEAERKSRLALNEVGIMAELDRKRRELEAS